MAVRKRGEHRDAGTLRHTERNAMCDEVVDAERKMGTVLLRGSSGLDGHVHAALDQRPHLRGRQLIIDDRLTHARLLLYARCIQIVYGTSTTIPLMRSLRQVSL